MSSEFLVKQTLIKIIENAKFDCERENYKWFKLNFLMMIGSLLLGIMI